MCDECQGQRCGGKFAPFFCANVTCLQVYFGHDFVMRLIIIIIKYQIKKKKKKKIYQIIK